MKKDMIKTSRKLLMLVIGLMAFVECAGQNTVKVKKGKIGGLYELSATGKTYQSGSDNQTYRLDTTTYISFNDFEKIKKVKSPYGGGDVLTIKLSESGRVKFEEMTKRNLGKQICFVLKDKVISAPMIMNTISGGMVNLSQPDKKVTEEIMNYLGK